MSNPFSENRTMQLQIGAASSLAGVKGQDLRIGTARTADGTLAREASTHSGDQIRHLTEPSAVGGDRVYNAILPVGGSLKRATDILIVATAIILLSPIMLIIYLAIWITSGTPAIFAHPRVGYNGRQFLCYKFRTMETNANETLKGYLRTNVTAANEWNQYQKLRHDPRITPLGHILRKSSLDELPQLFNVLRGEMSCVGPRPVPSDELFRYGDAAYDYLRARPGITGIWQISGRNKLDYAYRIALDRAYVCNWSFGKDIRILIKTVFVVLNFDETS